jgi:hypothetical protein
VSEITVTEWKRYGHHRGYAEDAAGTKLGFVDLKTGAVTLEDGAPQEATTSALLQWADARATSAPKPIAASGPTLVPVEPEWHDLADNQPGKSILAVAEELERESIAAHERAMGKTKSRITRAIVGKTESPWRKGYEGEEKVGKALDKLGKHGWRFIHSIPTGQRSDIDHLGIGPGGVVLVNTKAHPDAQVRIADWGIIVDGNKTDYAKQVKEQARRAHEALSRAAGRKVSVHPMVVIYVGNILRSKELDKIGDAGVEVATHLNMWLYFRGLEPTLTATEVDELYDVARRSTTWQ